MCDTSHPAHTSEVQTWYSLWQQAVIRKPNQKCFRSAKTIIKLCSKKVPVPIPVGARSNA